MSIIGNRFTHAHKCGMAIVPQGVNNTTVAGATILEPWVYGRTLTFMLAGDIPASTVLAVNIQGQKRSDDSWENITGLAFTSGNLQDGDALDNGYLQGELDLGSLDSTTYKAVRLSFVNGATTTAVCSGMYAIGDLFNQPSGDTDDLWATQRAL